jgi:hypothetical protein
MMFATKPLEQADKLGYLRPVVFFAGKQVREHVETHKSRLETGHKFVERLIHWRRFDDAFRKQSEHGIFAGKIDKPNVAEVCHARAEEWQHAFDPAPHFIKVVFCGQHKRASRIWQKSDPLPRDRAGDGQLQF